MCADQIPVDAYDRTARNADELDRLVAAHRAGSEPESAAQMASYIALLREAAPRKSSRQRLMLKLELDDGRWDVAESELDELPAVGDDVRLTDGRISRVRAIQTVLAGRTRKPPRSIVVCTLLAS